MTDIFDELEGNYTAMDGGGKRAPDPFAMATKPRKRRSSIGAAGKKGLSLLSVNTTRNERRRLSIKLKGTPLKLKGQGDDADGVPEPTIASIGDGSNAPQATLSQPGGSNSAGGLAEGHAGKGPAAVAAAAAAVAAHKSADLKTAAMHIKQAKACGTDYEKALDHLLQGTRKAIHSLPL